MKQSLPVLAAAIAALLGSGPAAAVTYNNIAGIPVDLPAGDVSFADELVDLSGGLVVDPDGVSSLIVPGLLRFPAGTTVPLPLARNGQMALGVPDLNQAAVLACGMSFEASNPNWVPGCNSVSLGVGGSLTVKFTDNALTGNGGSGLDLWIFETGPDIEDTFVEISKDGITWSAVGKVGGSTSGVDIDAFGFGAADLFAFVRLTDDATEGELDGGTVGADIDAIGAISTAVVPLPGSLWLLATALGGLAGRRYLSRRAYS